MRLVFVGIVLLAALIIPNIADETSIRAKIKTLNKKVIAECLEKNPDSSEDDINYLTMPVVLPTQKIGCMVGCIMNKTGSLTENHTLVAKNLLLLLEPYREDPRMYDALKEILMRCEVVLQSDIPTSDCEAAMKFKTCFYKNKHLLTEKQ